MSAQKKSTQKTKRINALSKTSQQVKASGDGGGPVRDKAAADSVQSCPLKKQQTDEPCDAAELTFVGLKGEKQIEKVNTNLIRKHRPKSQQKKPHDAAKRLLMESYDLILEIPSTPNLPDAGASFSEISVSRSIEGLCPNSEHPLLAVSFRNPDAGDETNLPLDWDNPNVSPHTKLPLPPVALPMDQRNRFYVKDLIDVFKIGELPIKEVEIDLLSCGVRAKGKLNHTIKGLVRAYRDEVWKLSLQIPAMKSVGHSYARETSRSVGYDSKDGWQNKKETLSNYTEKRLDGSSSSSGHKDGQKTWSESSDGLTLDSEGNFSMKDGGSLIEKSLDNKDDYSSFEVKPKLILSRNGVDVDFSELLGTVLSIKKKILGGFSDIGKVVPKVGFTYSLDIAFLEGSLELMMGVRNDSSISTDQYKWVSRYGDISIDLYFIKIKLSVGAGLECVSPDVLNWFGRKAYEIVVKLALDLSCALKLNYTDTLFGQDNPAIYEQDEIILVSGAIESKADFYLQFTARVCGYGVDSKAGVEGGLNVQVDVVLPLNFKGETKRTSCVLYAYFNYPGKRKNSPRWEKEIWKEKSLSGPGYLLKKS